VNDDAPETGPETAAESALRQLRRRYDDLRLDYESLLARLAEAEERAASPGATSEAVRFGVLEQMLAPLAALRDEYVEALGGLDRVVSGIEEILPRGMKGQRPAPAGAAPDGRIEVDVRGSSAAGLLAFRDRIAALEGIAGVSIHAIDPERAVLVVELA
jgi:hypothetical protein